MPDQHPALLLIIDPIQWLLGHHCWHSKAGWICWLACLDLCQKSISGFTEEMASDHWYRCFIPWSPVVSTRVWAKWTLPGAAGKPHTAKLPYLSNDFYPSFYLPTATSLALFLPFFPSPVYAPYAPCWEYWFWSRLWLYVYWGGADAV